MILGIGQHVAVGSLSDGPQVRRNLIPSLAKVHLDDSSSIDGIPLVRVHHNTKQSRVGVDELGAKANFQVMEDRGVIQVGQISHVLALLKLRRVDLSNLLRLEHFFLKGR